MDIKGAGKYVIFFKILFIANTEKDLACQQNILNELVTISQSEHKTHLKKIQFSNSLMICGRMDNWVLPAPDYWQKIFV